MTEADLFSLERFVTSQASVFETVIAELRAGGQPDGQTLALIGWTALPIRRIGARRGGALIKQRR
jgi:hypothetical protein